ncbi:TadE/TadG family type IV pilus assembly protein [Sphingobium sp. EM0848]|uniref:TadE/TadG family type IV pilus assembly protein n=1 Tax=Sphingobium sp. EM0848 TaxID=2743473 RepID=UPI00159C6B9F|nr:TadE/TadG family type IV pilus assembly protein [Sphingobium sp. EM0848]
MTALATSARGLRFLRRFMGNKAGAAAAEMALWFPVVGFLTLNVVDVAIYIYSKMQVETAAEQAVGLVRQVCNSSTLLPATYPTDHCSSTLSPQMASAAQQTTLGAGVTLGTLSEGYYCANASGALVAAGTLSSPSADCSAAVTGSTAKPGIYVNVQASYTYVPVFPGLSIMSYLSTSIQQTAWMRLQ